MNGSIDPITLIFIVLAIVIALKLFSVLGRRDEDQSDRRPMDGYAPREMRPTRPERERPEDNVVPLPTAHGDGDLATSATDTVDAGARIRKYARDNAALEKGLLDIVGVDRSFDPEHFIGGAKTAYEMIVMAFAEGNRKLLKQLLAKDVYEGFVQAIEDREKKNLIVDSSFVGIDKADIVNAELRNGRTARVTMKFGSSMITATHNKDGVVVDGDPKKVRDVTDIWTFARDASSRDPNWQLVATEAG